MTTEAARRELRLAAPVRRRWQVLVVAVPVVFLAAAAWHFRYMYDDGYIYLRIVQNVLAGNGPVFNAGERVETYTGPLWVLVLTLLGWPAPGLLPWIAVIAGIGMTLLAVIVATAASAAIARQVAQDAFLVPVGAALFAGTAVVWVFSSTGLETGLSFLWLSLCLFILVRWAASRAGIAWWALVVLGLGPLVRPELALASGVFVLAVLTGQWRAGRWPARFRVVVVALALPVAYQVFRMGYFGQMVAMTAIAKEGTLPRPGWGWDYLINFARAYWLVIPLLLVAAGGYLPVLLRLRATRWRLALLALPVAGVLNAAFVVLMGGDYIHGRLLLPAFFAVCAPLAVLPARREYVAGLLVAPWAVISAVWLRAPGGFRLPFVTLQGDGRVMPADFWQPDPIPGWWSGDGLYVSLDSVPVNLQKIDVPLRPDGPGTVMAAGAIGVVSYARPLGFYTYDVLGLANPLAAHMKLTARGLPGHEKPIPTPWMIAQLTPPGTATAPFDVIQAGRRSPAFPDPFPYSTGVRLQRETAWARAALRCPAIAEIVEGPRQPLSASRFWRNVVHAWPNTRMRVPPDPQAAYRQYCGAGQRPES